MKNLTDLRKTVETGVDPRLCAFVVQKKFKKKTNVFKTIKFYPPLFLVTGLWERMRQSNVRWSGKIDSNKGQ